MDVHVWRIIHTNLSFVLFERTFRGVSWRAVRCDVYKRLSALLPSCCCCCCAAPESVIKHARFPTAPSSLVTGDELSLLQKADDKSVLGRSLALGDQDFHSFVSSSWIGSRRNRGQARPLVLQFFIGRDQIELTPEDHPWASRIVGDHGDGDQYLRLHYLKAPLADLVEWFLILSIISIHDAMRGFWLMQPAAMLRFRTRT